MVFPAARNCMAGWTCWGGLRGLGDEPQAPRIAEEAGASAVARAIAGECLAAVQKWRCQPLHPVYLDRQNPGAYAIFKEGGVIAAACAGRAVAAPRDNWRKRMRAARSGRGTLGVLCLAATLLMAWMAYGQNLINLQCWVTYALLQDDNYTPLVDGSIVLIIGSSNNVIDPMNTYGETNYIARSTTGDDQIIGEVTIDSTELGSNGTFYSGDFYYDPDEVKWLYLRFFQETNTALTGMIHWGSQRCFQLQAIPSACCGWTFRRIRITSTTLRTTTVSSSSPSPAAPC